MTRLTLGYVIMGTLIDKQDFIEFCKGRPGVWYAEDVGCWVTTAKHAMGLVNAYRSKA